MSIQKLSDTGRALASRRSVRSLARRLGIAGAVVTLTLAAYAGGSGGKTEQPASAKDSGRDPMARLDGGSFPMGSASAHEDEKPVHEVRLRAFRIDRHEVTNRQFAEFVKATGHVTQAERDGYAWGFLEGDTDFAKIAGADWRHPDGPATSFRDRLDHPVVCVSWHDAAAYAKWAGKRLPTEAEWEYAARAGGKAQVRAAPAVVARDRDGAAPESVDGSCCPAKSTSDEAAASESPRESDNGGDGNANGEADTVAEANVWNGSWPSYRRRLRGAFSTTPVGSFASNPAGLEDMIGNVWEWTADWYAPDYYADSPSDNPRGPATGDRRVARGGSWFCSPAYCAAYTSHYRGASPPTHAFNNVGFRCAADAAPDQARKD